MVNVIRHCIKNHLPFSCNNFNDLCTALSLEYGTNGVWVNQLSTVLYQAKSFERHKNVSGSFNINLKWWPGFGQSNSEVTTYKVFKKSNDNNFRFEFHDSQVPTNQWLQSDVSGSAGLSGLKYKVESHFHTLMDNVQATNYCNFSHLKNDAFIKRVKIRKCKYIDLIYVPPNQFVWGVDAYEMFVDNEL